MHTGLEPCLAGPAPNYVLQRTGEDVFRFNPPSAARPPLNTALGLMLGMFRKRKPEAAEAPRDLSPQRHQFHSVEEWLSAWVGHHLAKPRSFSIRGTPVIPLIGSLGFDSALSRDGTVWVAFYDLSPQSPPEEWRTADAHERTWLLVCAARRFPALNLLLPSKPQDAISCPECSGTGFTLNNVVVCMKCSALGWLPHET